MELSPRSMLLLKVYDRDLFRKLRPDQASAGTTKSGTVDGSPQGGRPIEFKLQPMYPMKRAGAIASKESISVVAPSFNILSTDLRHPISNRERVVSSRKISADPKTSARKRHNRSVIVEKTQFEPVTPIRKSISGLPSTRHNPEKKDVKSLVEGTRIPTRDFIDIRLNRGKARTKSDFGTNAIQYYKSTFPGSTTTSYFIKPEELPGVKVEHVLMTQLSSTATANHLWMRHSSRMRLQSMGTMTPATKNYPLNDELPCTHLPHSVRPKSIEMSKAHRKAQATVKFPPSHQEFNKFLGRIKETERIIRQEENFARKVRALKPSIQLEPSESKTKGRKHNGIKDPTVEPNKSVVVPGKRD